jgi:carboxyl-terminal processing protease
MLKIRNTFLVLAMVGVSLLAGYKIGERKISVISNTGQLDLSMMWTVKDKLQQTFLNKEKMVDKTMVYGAISGMVASLGDPYTVYLPPDQNKSTNEDLAGQFGGVGISLGYKDKNIAVMSPLPKTPAEKAGLLAGDLILNITDKANNVNKDTNGMALEEAVNLIRGKVGTEVILKIFRIGKPQPWEVTLKRDNIIVPGVELEWKNSAKGKIAWVKMYKFSDTLYKEWTPIVEQIAGENKKGNVVGVVMDLRNNPGGYLQASVMVASDFLKEGVVVSQQSSDGSVQNYSVDKSLGRLLNIKLVVLVNGGSASASEILAGALKDYKRAQLVGEKTFGKGTVQQPEDFPDGSGLHVTIAKWLLPNGLNIHGVGVEPNVTVVYTPPTDPTSKVDNQLDKAIEVLIKQ